MFDKLDPIGGIEYCSLSLAKDSLRGKQVQRRHKPRKRWAYAYLHRVMGVFFQLAYYLWSHHCFSSGLNF